MTSAPPTSAHVEARLAVKICGISTPETLEAALDAGAEMIGLNFHPRSPRFVTLERARELAGIARGRAEIVALVVDYDEARADELAEALRPDWLQLHGSETPALAAAIRQRTGRRIMKVLGVSAAGDLDQIAAHRAACDLILLDAKAPKDAAYPGGHGRPFDWTLLSGLDPASPFLLAGGLTPENVAAAIRTVRGLDVRLVGVDVSSGVEAAPGVKDPARIKAFVSAAHAG